MEIREMPTRNRILSRKAAALRLGLSERTLDRLCETASGLHKVQLSARRIGIAEAEVDAYLEHAVSQAQAA
jgi:predicted DNA-binding transcriptional regulator AlpA